jgi:hypothetical protein
MNDDKADFDGRRIITVLQLEAGRIIEDVSGELAIALPDDAAVIDAHLDELREAAEDVRSLLAAAHVLHRRRAREGERG